MSDWMRSALAILMIIAAMIVGMILISQWFAP